MTKQQIQSARGKNVEKIGDFKRIGRKVYQMGRDYIHFKKQGYDHVYTLEENEKFSDYINDMILFSSETNG